MADQAIVQKLETVAKDIRKAKKVMEKAAPGQEKVAALNYLTQLERNREVLLMQHLQSGGGFEDVEYSANPVGHRSFTFDAPLPEPINLLQAHARLGNVFAVPHQYGDVLKIVNGTSQSELAQDVVTFLRGNKMGTSEDALHGRDDALIEIIVRVGGLQRPERNKISDGSTCGLTFDVVVGQPPLVVIEEKDLDGKLLRAQAETRDKLAWIPHYAKLPFVVGIAIAGDRMAVRAITKNGPCDKPKPVTFNLTKLADRIGAVRAAVNIGLLCKYVVSHDLVPSVAVPFNAPQHDIHGRRTIVVTWQQVEKTYNHLPKARQTGLCDFYRATREVPYLEHLDGEPVRKDGKLRLRLRPVGLAECTPSSVEEAKVSMHCVLTALEGCHAKQWAHQDVRWANVIRLESEHYVLIVCEYADRFGGQVPSELKVQLPDGVVQCSAGTDLWLVGQMLDQLKGSIEFDQDLKQLHKLLTSWKRCRELTVDAVMTKSPWIRNTTLRQSPGKGDKPSQQQQQLQQRHAKSGEQAATVQKQRSKKSSKKQSKGTETRQQSKGTEMQGSNKMPMGAKRRRPAAHCEAAQGGKTKKARGGSV